MNAALRDAAPGTVKIPRRAMYLRDPAEDAHLELGKGDDPRRFHMVALTGKPLAHWWFGTLAIELSGIRMKQRLPVLKDHDSDQRLGFTTSLKNEPGKGIIAEGQLMADSEAAKVVLADAAQGFPWQASTYLQAHRLLRVPPGEEAKCNGQTVKGPAMIFLESTLREVTFCALGVDDDTSATPLAGTDAGEEIAVTLMETNMSEQKQADKATEGGTAAPAPKIDTAALAAEAQKAERARVAAILGASADVQRELTAKLINDGTPVEAALAEIARDLRERLSAKRVEPNSNHAPLAAGNTANVTPTTAEDAKLKAMPEGEEKWKAEFAADAKLRAEFGGDADLYLGWKTNEQRRAAAAQRG